MVDLVPQSESGEFSAVQDTDGIHFEKRPEPEKTGQAYVETAKAKSKRDLELEAGAARVQQAAAELASRPPRIISDNERRAQGSNTPIFRPNMLGADRVIQSNGMPVSQALGALMRKVGGGAAPPQG